MNTKEFNVELKPNQCGWAVGHYPSDPDPIDVSLSGCIPNFNGYFFDPDHGFDRQHQSPSKDHWTIQVYPWHGQLLYVCNDGLYVQQHDQSWKCIHKFEKNISTPGKFYVWGNHVGWYHADLSPIMIMFPDYGILKLHQYPIRCAGRVGPSLVMVPHDQPHQLLFSPFDVPGPVVDSQFLEMEHGPVQSIVPCANGALIFQRHAIHILTLGNETTLWQIAPICFGYGPVTPKAIGAHHNHVLFLSDSGWIIMDIKNKKIQIVDSWNIKKLRHHSVEAVEWYQSQTCWKIVLNSNKKNHDPSTLLLFNHESNLWSHWGKPGQDKMNLTLTMTSIDNQHHIHLKQIQILGKGHGSMMMTLHHDHPLTYNHVPLNQPIQVRERGGLEKITLETSHPIHLQNIKLTFKHHGKR